MNEFSDVDPRTKQEELREGWGTRECRAEPRKRADTPESIRNYQQGTPLGERVRQLGEDVGSSVEDAKGGRI